MLCYWVKTENYPSSEKLFLKYLSIEIIMLVSRSDVGLVYNDQASA